MATTRVYLGAGDSAKIYRIGQVGFDTGNQDSGAQDYTIKIETERQYPAGRDALVYWRRVAIRINRTAPADVTVKVYVDEVQTQTYTAAGVAQDQTIVFNLTGGGEREDVLEADINAVGSSIRIYIEVTSSDIDGILLFEPIEAHGLVIRPAKSRSAEVS
jgi:hypothetical protein